MLRCMGMHWQQEQALVVWLLSPLLRPLQQAQAFLLLLVEVQAVPVCLEGLEQGLPCLGQEEDEAACLETTSSAGNLLHACLQFCAFEQVP